MTREPAPPPGPGLVAQLAATGGGEAAARVAQLLTVALIGQTLGVAGLGIVGLAWSLTVLVLAVVQGGPELAGVRLLGMGAPSSAAVIHATTVLKLRLALASIPLLFSVQWALGHSQPEALLQLAAQACAVLAVSTGFAWAFRGLYRPKEQAAIRSVQAFGGLLLLWLILQVWPSPLAAPVAECLAGLAAAAIGWHRLRSPKERPESGSLRAASSGLLTNSLALGLANLASTLGWMAPILAAARWSTLEDVSYLTGALRLLLGGVGIIQIGFQAIYPALVRLQTGDPRAAAVLIAALMIQSTAAASVTALALALIAPALTPFLLGDELAPAGPVLAALAPLLIPITFSSAISYALMGRGETRLITHIGVGAAILTALLCAVSFQVLPGPWGVLALHVAAWGQTVAICIAGHRRGVFTLRAGGWRALLDTRALLRRLSSGAPDGRSS